MTKLIETVAMSIISKSIDFDKASIIDANLNEEIILETTTVSNDYNDFKSNGSTIAQDYIDAAIKLAEIRRTSNIKESVFREIEDTVLSQTEFEKKFGSDIRKKTRTFGFGFIDTIKVEN